VPKASQVGEKLEPEEEAGEALCKCDQRAGVCMCVCVCGISRHNPCSVLRTGEEVVVSVRLRKVEAHGQRCVKQRERQDVEGVPGVFDVGAEALWN
jgi:hypothetical protein